MTTILTCFAEIVAMKKTVQETGRYGERLAASYLRSKGYFILERNWRKHYLEVDIIASQGEVAVFIEVKYRSGKQYGEAEEFVDNRKMRHLVEAADVWLRESAWEGDLRFDIIAITTEGSKQYIEHIENAFIADLS
jgi:putative endonuclease